MWYHTWPWQEVYEYLAREVVLQCVGKAGLKADLLDKRQDSVRANYDVGPPQPGVTKLKQAILMALEKEHAVLLILDGLPASGARQVAAHVGEVARQRRNERITALADLVASMTPQAGSDMVASLSDEDAQWILLTIARKSQRKAAKLMALMPTERAAQLSQLYLDLDPKAVPKGDVLSPIDGAAAPDGAASPPSARTDAQRPAPEEAQAP